MEPSAREAVPSAGYPRVSLRFKCKLCLINSLAGDGVYATSQSGNISLVDLKSNTTTTLVRMRDVRDVSPFAVGVWREL